jgi:hypothetical protein
MANMPTTATAKKSVFNLDTFQKESKVVEYSVPEDFTTADQLSSFSSADLLKLVNSARKRQALLDAKDSIVGANAAAVYKFISQWRVIPRYAAIEARSEQTNKILEDIKAMPVIFEDLKTIAMSAQSAVEDEDEE